MGAVRVKCAKCGASLFTSSAGRKKVEEPTVVMRPYKEFQVREFEELSEHDFVTKLVCENYSAAAYHDGIMWVLNGDNRKYTDELRANDIQLLASAEYCFMQYTPIIKSKGNISIPVIRYNGPDFIALAKMAWAKKKKEKS